MLVIVLALVISEINNTGATQVQWIRPIAVTPITTREGSVKVNGQHLGDPNAPVKVDVWEDFQCSAWQVLFRQCGA